MNADPAKSLNKDLLKKTAGLLAEIDRVVAAPTTAERVNRVIESAAPDRRYDTFESYEAWEEWKVHGMLPGPRRHTPERCGCPTVEAWYQDEPTHEGDDGVRPMKMLECEAYEPKRDEPIWWTQSPYQFFDLGVRTHSAQEPCGAEGCACEDLWSKPKTRWDLTWEPDRYTPRGPSATYTIYDEVTHVPDEYMAVIEARIRERFAELSVPTSLLDITGVD